MEQQKQPRFTRRKNGRPLFWFRWIPANSTPDVSLDELEELARTAGADVRARLTQKRESPDKATCIGSGRLEELTALCENGGIPLVIFDRELTATQLRNLEETTGRRVIDRTTLILDIFAAVPVRRRPPAGGTRAAAISASPPCRTGNGALPFGRRHRHPQAPVKPNWNPTAAISAGGFIP